MKKNIWLFIIALIFTGCTLDLNPQDGQDGTNGTNGLNGLNGLDGTNGTDGKDGKDGLNGSDGATGESGKDGLDGKDGIDGLDGLDGIDGINGLDGTNGTNGIDGIDGVNGVNGFDGTNGIDGIDGISGTYVANIVVTEDNTLIITYSDGVIEELALGDDYLYDNNLGDWQWGRAYRKCSIVQYNGSSYVALWDTRDTPYGASFSWRKLK